MLELVKSVFDSMEQTGKTPYSPQESDAYRSFLQQVSQPRKIGNVTPNTVSVETAIRSLFAHVIGKSGVGEYYCEDYQVMYNLEQKTVGLELPKRRVEMASIHGGSTRAWIKERVFSQRSLGKLVSAVGKHIEEFVKANGGKVLTSGEALLDYFQEDIKGIINDYFDMSPYYVYFTNLDVERHYTTMRDTCNLNSCMAYSPTYYANYQDGTGEFVHPVEGFNHAPDFRLALLSTLSPDEIVNATEYPFIARAMVTYNDNGDLVFRKCYGIEKAEQCYKQIAEWVVNLSGRRFYAVECRGVEESFGKNNAHERLAGLHDSKLHYVAPYIDITLNTFYTYGDTKYVGGRNVMVCYTVDEDLFDLPDDAIGCSVYHSTGIIQGADNTSNEGDPLVRDGYNKDLYFY